MSRALLFVFALMQAQVIVTLAVAPTTVCPERCADDEADGGCPPVCLSCPASSHTAAPVSVAALPTSAVRRQALPALAARRPAEPEPGDIFHVPKRPLA